MKTNETFNEIVNELVQSSNDQVYTGLLDAGFTPDEAYETAFHAHWAFEAQEPWYDEAQELEEALFISDASVF